MHVGSCAAEVPDKFQIDAIIITPNFSGLRNFETGFARTSYRKISWSLEAESLGLDISNRSETWHARRQLCCRGAW